VKEDEKLVSTLLTVSRFDALSIKTADAYFGNVNYLCETSCLLAALTHRLNASLF